MASSYEQQIRFSADVSPAERAVNRLSSGLNKVEKLARGALDGLKKNTRLNFDTRGAEQQLARLQRGIAGLSQRVRVRVEETYTRRAGQTSPTSSVDAGGGADTGALTLFAANSVFTKNAARFRSEVEKAKDTLQNSGFMAEELTRELGKGAEAATKLLKVEERIAGRAGEIEELTRKRNAAAGQAKGLQTRLDRGLIKNPDAIKNARIEQAKYNATASDLSAKLANAQTSYRQLNNEAEKLKGITQQTGTYIENYDTVLDRAAKKRAQRQQLGRLPNAALAGLAFSNIPGQEFAQAAGAGALVAGPAGAAAAAVTAVTVSAVAAAGPIAKWTAELEKSRIALQGISGSSSEYKTSLEGIAKVSKALNVPIGEATKQFTSLRAAMAANGNTAAESLAVYRNLVTINKALGGDSEKLNGILLASTQIFSKGRVSAEELRGQLGERLPGAVADFAASMGVTTAQLDKMLEDGKVTVADFIRYTDTAAKKYESTAKRIAQSSADAGARLTTAWEGYKEAIGPILTYAGAEIQKFATNALNAITPVTDAIARFLQLNNKGRNDRLFEVNQLIKRNENTLSDLSGRTDEPAESLRQTLRRQTLDLKREKDELERILYPKNKPPQQQQRPNTNAPDPDEQRKALEEAARLQAGINTELGRQLQAEFELRSAGKSTYQQLLLKQSLLEKLTNLQRDTINSSTDDPSLKVQQLATAQAELVAETAKLKQEYADLITELRGVATSAYEAMRSLDSSAGTAIDSPLEAQLRGVREEVEQTTQKFKDLQVQIEKLAAGGEADLALKPLLDSFKQNQKALQRYNDPALQNLIASQRLTSGDKDSLEEQQRQLQLQVAALQQGRTELTGMEELISRYGVDWANLDSTVKGHLVDLARTNDALAQQLQQLQQIRADAEALSGITVTGIQEALVASVTGGDVRAAFASMFEQLGNQFLTQGLRPVQEWLTNEIAKLLGLTLTDGLQTAATNANTSAVAAATTTITSTVVPTVTANTTAVTALTSAVVANTAAQSAGSATSAVSGFNIGSLFGGGGGLGSLFGGATSGLGAAAAGVGFNPVAFTPGLSFFADGGFVTGPTKAWIGEGGSGGEYAIPANKMNSAMQRWNAGMRGDAVVNGADSTSGSGEGVSGGGITLNVTATRIADDKWVKVDDLQVALAQTRRQAAQDGAKAGEARTLSRLRNSPGARRRVGL